MSLKNLSQTSAKAASKGGAKIDEEWIAKVKGSQLGQLKGRCKLRVEYRPLHVTLLRDGVINKT